MQPIWDRRCWHRLIEWWEREKHSRHLAGWHRLEHYELATARRIATNHLAPAGCTQPSRCLPEAADAVLMMDDDQFADVASSPARPVLDHLADVVSLRPDAIHVGITAQVADGVLNVQVTRSEPEHRGPSLSWGGTGFMLIPRRAWGQIVEHLGGGDPWSVPAEGADAEDRRMCAHARSAGVPILPIRNLRTYHLPQNPIPLCAETPDLPPDVLIRELGPGARVDGVQRPTPAFKLH